MLRKAFSHHQEILLWGTVLTFMVALAYGPIVNNGFIADDWVILERIDAIQMDPLHLQTVPPENFRATSYLVFGVLKYLGGYRPGNFYVFNIALHLANAFLLLYLVWTLTSDGVTAAAAAAFFAVFQAPHEAVMWLAAMNETLQGFFILLSSIFWARRQYGAGGAAYALALFSKESAVIALLILPWIDIYSGRRPLGKRTLLLALPTAVFLLVFAATWSRNFMVGSGAYALSVHGIVVLVKSLNGMLWPWLYLAIATVWLSHRRWPSGRALAGFLLCAVPMLPYMFVAYSQRLSSRQLYLASAVFCVLLAILLRPVWQSRWVATFAAVFVMYNIAYLRIRKDPAFEQRAAPTTELTRILRSESPKRLRLEGLSGPYLSAARASTLAVPGWSPELIFSRHVSYGCAECPVLRWDENRGRWEASE